MRHLQTPPHKHDEKQTRSSGVCLPKACKSARVSHWQHEYTALPMTSKWQIITEVGEAGVVSGCNIPWQSLWRIHPAAYGTITHCRFHHNLNFLWLLQILNLREAACLSMHWRIYIARLRSSAHYHRGPLDVNRQGMCDHRGVVGTIRVKTASY